MLHFGLTLLATLCTPDVDPRTAYDVVAYRLDLDVTPDTKKISGTVVVEARIVLGGTDTIVLDLQKGFEVTRVVELKNELSGTSALENGRALTFRYTPPLLHCELARGAEENEVVRVAVSYSGSPRARDSFTGFHWQKTATGSPWITTSCQDTGSASWWPSKDSYFHPEDKPERVFENYTVPKGLYAVGNGRLASRAVNAEDTETFGWVHEYPLETYCVALNVAPYHVVVTQLEVAGNKEPLDFIYYVLPENAEKAALQFQDVGPMLEAFTAAFGPYPFPKSKFALVETSFWGMEHSTAVAYGSSYPAWLKANGGRDRYADRNKEFDYILVHESAHEWWGNAVSTRTWGDFWLHEGFATYAEAVYLERVKGREVADRHLKSWRSSISKNVTLYRGDDVDSGAAYNINIYSKGAWVLNTLRTYVNDDARFFAALRAFNMEFRYKNASTSDFRAIVERETKHDWKTFFDEWVYGAGQPQVEGSVRIEGANIVVDVTVSGTSTGEFHPPLDLSYRLQTAADARSATDASDLVTRRIWLQPGENRHTIAVGAGARDLTLPTVERILWDARIQVE